MRSRFGPLVIGIDAPLPSRRQSLTIGASALLGSSLAASAALTGSSEAAPIAVGSTGDGGQLQTVADYIAVNEVILRERVARESHAPEDESACFYPNATVAVSWFKGDAAKFVETGRERATTETLNFDSMSPAVISLNGGRATAEASCAVHTFTTLASVDIRSTSYTRLLWHVQKFEERWLIAALDCIYIRDEIAPCYPDQELKLDREKLGRYRASYRYLSYILLATGRPCYDDLPGVDRPESVSALRSEAKAWLKRGSS